MTDTTSDLPIYEVLPEIRQRFAAQHTLVLAAPPGAGKTTAVPLALLDEAWCQRGLILMLEPRRVAARTAAHRMAQLLGEEAGGRVGYQIRHETRRSKATRILVVTEGVLLRWLQEDPSLGGIALVIFDEFHERHLDSDLSLALCLQSRELFRDDSDPLRLLIMSATLDTQALTQSLHAPLITSAGRRFPVSLHYAQTPLSLKDDLVQRVAETIHLALEHGEGGLLVFLPGQGEILAVSRRLRDTLAENLRLLPLYGAMSLEQQQHAINPLHEPGSRKVVLATDIAETSLTIADIDTVIDSGLCRVARFDPRTGITRLHTERISKAASEQRAGRAGRLTPGRCFRLWTQEQHARLIEQREPEFLTADLLGATLQILNWGLDDFAELTLLDPPKTGAVQQALHSLEGLGATALNTDRQRRQLSPHGRQLAHIPAHPKIAQLLLYSKRIGQERLGAQLAAVLSDRVPSASDDLLLVLESLSHPPREPSLRGWRERSLTQARSFERVVADVSPEPRASSTALSKRHHVIAYLLAQAFPERIAKRTDGRGKTQDLRYKLANGRGAVLPGHSALAHSEWLIVADLGGKAGQTEDRIFLAAALDPGLFDGPLQRLRTRERIVQWAEQEQRLHAEERDCIGAIVLQRRVLTQLDAEEKKQALLTYLRQSGLRSLPWNEACEQLCARVRLLCEHQPDAAWPRFDEASLQDQVEDWLGPFLDGIGTLTELNKLNVHAILLSRLDWPQQQSLESLLPAQLSVPSGTKHSVDYKQTPPVLAVKLQEMFGCLSQPSVLQGRMPVSLHLLSPARRPLQITQDIAGFWQSSYHDVKKEMKGRYPKHPWPDDPLSATATAFTKKKAAQQTP